MHEHASRIVYVGHSTVLVDLDGVKLLTDPLLRPRLLHLRRAGKLDTRALRGVDAVLVSHLHFDHLDFPSLEKLGRELPVIVPRGAGGLMRKRGFRSVSELAPDEELAIGAVTVVGTPAVHDSSRMPFGARAEPLGFTIRGSRSVYFAGDTELFDGMSELGPVDVALLPIWGWGPGLGGGGHMDPREAAEAARLLQPSLVVPIHWGTYFPAHHGLRRLPAFIEAPAAQFVAHMAETAPGAEVRVLQPGEETDFAGLSAGSPR
jgi:L-ascorbate metabolism protein UlaG (beta-lactamase superfamily)